MQADRDLVIPDALDGLVELDLALVDLDLVGDEEIGDIDGGDGAVEDAALAHLLADRDPAA